MTMNPYLSDDPPPCGQGCDCPQCLADARDEAEQIERFEEDDFEWSKRILEDGDAV